MFRPGQLTPMQKAVAVNTAMGNPGIANQQGTTRVMYDTLPLDGSLEFRFFENVANRAFPFTNLNQNRLQVGETFALMRISFQVGTVDEEGLWTWENISTALPALGSAQFDVYFDTMQVVKPIPFTSILADWSHSSRHENNEWFQFDNLLALPTDVQFRCEVDAAAYGGAQDNTYLRCTWEGFGTILSPKTQF